MQPSTNSGVESGKEFSPSSTNDSPNSTPSKPTSSLRDKEAKLNLAHQARLIQDNHRILDETAKDDKFLREQRRVVSEAQRSKMFPDADKMTTPASDDMGDITIDSPEIHNHYPPPQQPASGGMSKLAVAGIVAASLLAGGGGAAAVVAMMSKAQPVATVAPTPPSTEFQIRWSIGEDGKAKTVVVPKN